MIETGINTPYIKLDQFLKLSGLCNSGGEAKETIKSGQIIVNGEAEIRRGKKLRDGDIVSFGNKQCIVRQDGDFDGDKKASS